MLSFGGLVEKTKQRWKVGDKTFKPTPNVRNPAMLTEAQEFSRHMQTFKQMAQVYEKQMSTFLATLPVVNSTNLPRVWEAIEGTNMCEPMHPEATSSHPYRTGGDYDEVLLADSAEIMRRRMEAIVRPIDRWLDSLSVVKSRMTRVEELRVQVDARRRRVHKRWMRTLRHLSAGQAAAIRTQTAQETTAGGRRASMATSTAPPAVFEEEGEAPLPAGPTVAAAPTSGGGGGGGGGGGAGAYRGAYSQYYGGLSEEEEEDLDQQRSQEDHAREAINQQRQLEALSESYHEQEQLVFEQLSGLVRDAAYFKSYVAATFLVIKDTLQATLAALGSCKRPLPGFSERESSDANVVYGRVDSIMDLVDALPPVVKEGGRHLPHGIRAPSAVAPDHIRPTRMTAQPLQVAADDVSGPAARYAPVPSVPRISRAEFEPAAPFYEAEAGNGASAGGYGRAAGYEAGGEYGYGAPFTTTGGEEGPGQGRTFPALQEAVTTQP